MKYCRCSIYDEDAIKKNITFPCYTQLKCDGSYREAVVSNGTVKFYSRAGKEYSNPVLEKELLELGDGIYMGEWTIGPADNPKENRFKGNGELNSKNPPYEDIYFTVWDYIDNPKFVQARYKARWEALKTLVHCEEPKHIKLVPTYYCKGLAACKQVAHMFMAKGLEGAIIKDFNYMFFNGTSKLQYKVKLCLDADMRITGFTEGTGKRKQYIGAIEFANDEKTIIGQCSGFTDKQMIEFSKEPSKYIGKVITVEFNDIIKSPDKPTFTLNHPRFVSIRDDKTDTDTLERVFAIKHMTLYK